MTNTIIDRYDPTPASAAPQPSFTVTPVVPDEKSGVANVSLPAIAKASAVNDSMLVNDLPTNISETNLNQLESALTKLQQNHPDIDVYIGDYSDILRYIGTVLIKNADAMRKGALDDRLVARAIARDALLGQADKLNEAAIYTMIYATCALVVGIVTAVGSITSQAKTMRNSAEIAKVKQDEAEQLAPVQAETRKLESDLSYAEAPENKQPISAVIEGNRKEMAKISKTAQDDIAKLEARKNKSTLLGLGFEAGGNTARTAHSVGEGHIKLMEADAQLDGANNQYFQSQSDIKKELYDKIVDIIQQSISMYKEMMHSQAEAMRAITRA